MNVYAITFCVSLFLFLNTARAHAADYLTECRNKQVKPLQGQWMQLSYRESQNVFYHSAEPWQVRNVVSTGNIWCTAENFFQADTVSDGKKSLVSKIQFTPTELLLQYYWKKNLSPVTKSMVDGQLLETIRYSPVLLLEYCATHTPSVDSTSETDVVIYTLDVNAKTVKVYIRTSDCLVEKVTTTQHDDLWGDMTQSIRYSNFTRNGQLHYARNIQVEKIHGIRDDITISAVEMVDNAEALLEKSADYSIADDEHIVPEVRVQKMSENIYSIDLPHAQSRACLVEFKDFFVVLDAPLSSENGELVIAESQKIAPGKPVKYYAFGHHHPWYIGGVRAFIHRGATILCTPDNLSYLHFIAEAPHTLQPDSLQLEPRPLATKLVDSITTITDGNFEMKMYHIGAKSGHTNDYVLFYFPSEKLLLEGDLAWISADGTVRKASRTQSALYRAIQELGLEVKTIVQSWPIGAEYGVKSVFSFEELEQSVDIE
jgi:glyoxylase-like metal-dependent hydrolase (beta-lactamase superfamily II)